MKNNFYHYTSVAALDTIFTISKSVDAEDEKMSRKNVMGKPITSIRPDKVILYATHINYLNDTSEFLFGVGKFIALLRDSKNGLCDEIRTALLTHFERYIQHGSNNEIYITCFSSEINEIDLWRGYSEEASGVAIRFPKDRLVHLGRRYSNVTFSECVYEEELQNVLISDALKTAVKMAAEADWSKDKSKLGQIIAKIAIQIESQLIYIKNEAYSNEKEWRMVLRNPIRELQKESYPDSQGAQDYIRMHPEDSRKREFITDAEFRAGRYGLTPFVKVPYYSPPDGIIVGPSTHQSATRHAINLLLSQRLSGDSDDSVSVQNSDIPYRA